MDEERTTIFSNTFTASEEAYRQLYWRIRRLVTWLVTIFALGASVYIICAIIRFASVYAANGMSFFRTLQAWFLILLVVYLCFNIWLMLSAPRRLAKKALKRVQELNNDQIPEETAAFTADLVVFHNSATNGEATVRYPSFTKVQETKDLFLLWTAQKQVLPLAKSGFTGIDAAGFRAFMDEKCPNAKRFWIEGA